MKSNIEVTNRLMSDCYKSYMFHFFSTLTMTFITELFRNLSSRMSQAAITRKIKQHVYQEANRVIGSN